MTGPLMVSWGMGHSLRAPSGARHIGVGGGGGAELHLTLFAVLWAHAGEMRLVGLKCKATIGIVSNPVSRGGLAL